MNERNAVIFDGPTVVLRVSGEDSIRRVRVDLRDVWVLDVCRVTEPFVADDTGHIGERVMWTACLIGPGGGELELELESRVQAYALIDHWERVRGCTTADSSSRD